MKQLCNSGKKKKHLKPSSLGVQLRIKRMILGPANHTISIYAQVQTWQHIPLQKRFKQGQRSPTKFRPRNTESSLDVPHLASAQQSSCQAIYNTSWWKIVYTLQQWWIIQPFSLWWSLQLESKCLIWWQLTSEALTLNWIQYQNPLRNDFFSNQQLCNNVRSLGSNGALKRDDDYWISKCVDVAGFVSKRGFNRVSRERDLGENKTSNKGFRGELMEDIKGWGRYGQDEERGAESFIWFRIRKHKKGRRERGWRRGEVVEIFLKEPWRWGNLC